MESDFRRIKTGENNEIIVEQVEKSKYTEIFVHYVGRLFARMVFVVPNLLFVYATENDYIDLDTFDALTNFIPNRRLVREALKQLPNNFNPGVTLKAVIFAEDEQSIFMDSSSFSLVIDGKRARIEESFKSSEIFVNHMLPFLTYKDILQLERIKFFRLILSNRRLGVWQTLFEQGFSQLYASYLLPGSTTKDEDLEIQTKSNALCKFLDNISKSDSRIYTADPDRRPYWKLLYEYHFMLPMRPNWVTSILSLPSNRTTIFGQNPVPLDDFKPCAMFKGSLICFGGTTGLMSSSLNKGWTSKTYIPQPHDTPEAREAEKLFAFRINNAQADFVARVLKFVLVKDAFKEVTVRDNLSILAFESREDHIFCSILNSRKNRTLNCIFGPLRDKRYITDKIDDNMHMGLIGNTGYFIRSVINPFEQEESNFETIIVDPKREVEIVLDYTKNIHVCYNTPSNCFIQSEKNLGRVNYVWKILEKSGVKNVLPDTVIVTQFDPFGIFTLSEKYWVWKTNENRLIIVHKNKKVWNLDLDDIITDICIVGDRLYVLSSPSASITFIELELPGVTKRLQGSLTKFPKLYKRCLFKTLLGFDYIRTSPTGLVLYSKNPMQTPMWLLPNVTTFKLLGCQICQTPSEFMCSECKTPACSEEHFKCCKK